MNKTVYVLVNEAWLQGLLDQANDMEAYENSDLDYNHRWTWRAIKLQSYAKSAGTILKYNEKIEK